MPKTNVVKSMMAKVVFVHNGKRELIPATFNQSYAFCKWWIGQHEIDPRYRNGLLQAVSVYVKTDL